jgi:hypothetical protein
MPPSSRNASIVQSKDAHNDVLEGRRNVHGSDAPVVVAACMSIVEKLDLEGVLHFGYRSRQQLSYILKKISLHLFVVGSIFLISTFRKFEKQIPNRKNLWCVTNITHRKPESARLPGKDLGEWKPKGSPRPEACLYVQRAAPIRRVSGAAKSRRLERYLHT